MYTVQINDDNSVSTIVRQSIIQGYKLSDWFWIFAGPKYQGVLLDTCTAFIQIAFPASGNTRKEKLILKPDTYNGKLKYSISPTSKITNEAGVVKAKIIFETDDNEVFRETDEFYVHISSSAAYHDDPPSYNKISSGCDCNTDEGVARLVERTRPLIFDSVNVAEEALNSGELKNTYLGQSVIIVSNGKYVLYTVQSNSSNDGYIVEPVDTVEKGTVWEDDDDEIVS